ncbi:MAG TPA: hypothetical protein VGS27_36035 [Candidatus Sulfotelmatobacter sp.]|nr:hypothetical protein [Candidatus Sulfotelmatobacter sp.]
MRKNLHVRKILQGSPPPGARCGANWPQPTHHGGSGGGAIHDFLLLEPFPLVVEEPLDDAPFAVSNGDGA